MLRRSRSVERPGTALHVNSQDYSAAQVNQAVVLLGEGPLLQFPLLHYSAAFDQYAQVAKMSCATEYEAMLSGDFLETSSTPASLCPDPYFSSGFCPVAARLPFSSLGMHLLVRGTTANTTKIEANEVVELTSKRQQSAGLRLVWPTSPPSKFRE